MSLNQTFLKLYGEKVSDPLHPVCSPDEARAPRLRRRCEDGIDGMGSFLRIDRGDEIEPKESSVSHADERSECDFFSIKDEYRLRNLHPESECNAPVEGVTGSSSRGNADRSVKYDSVQRSTEFRPYNGGQVHRSSCSVPNSPGTISIRQLSEKFPPSVPQTCSSWCDDALDRALVWRMPNWPAECRQLFDRGEDEFAQLTDNVLAAMQKGNKIFGFGGWGRGTGVSTLVLGVLDEMVRCRRKVLVLDANFQNPQLAEILRIPVDSGWENLLDMTESFGSGGLIRVETEKCPFWLLPLLSQSVPDAVTASCKKRWLYTLLELAGQFDLVLIDHGSLQGGNSREKVFELFRFGCDGYFMVTDARSPLRGEAAGLPAISDGYQLPCLGVIENFA